MRRRQWRSWAAGEIEEVLDAVSGCLLAERPEALRITGVGNARVAAGVQALRQIEAADERESVEVLRARVSEAELSGGCDPERLWQLAEAQGYEVE